MTNPTNNHDVTIALHSDRLARFEKSLERHDGSLESISRSLEALTKLELHHTETRQRCDRLDRLIEGQGERIKQLEDIEKRRAGAMKAIGFIWAAIGGLIVIELWRFIGGHP